MEAMEIEFGDPTEEIDSIEWVLETLRASYAVREAQKLVREIAQSVAKADNPDKVEAVQDAARAFYVLSTSLVSRRQESEAGPGFEDAIARHADRKVNGHMTRGMLLGLDQIDSHILGIHPGEIAIMGASTGVGKSWAAGRTALQEWQRGRRVVLWTLENDLEMTFDRLVCMAAHVPYDLWQRGECNASHERLVDTWNEKMRASDCQPVVIHADLGERDPVSMVRKTFTLGGESMIIDQLSHIEAIPGTKMREAHQRTAEIMRTLQAEISTGIERLPLFMLTQINREGRLRAAKAGRYEFNDFALSTEVENISDHLWAVYQSEDHRATERALFQMLKFRRGKPQDFEMRWRLDVGDIRVLHPVEEDA
jgi:hypothetical protein